eukprot:11074168-Ditylum_brightwellii.AAC.1
MAIGIITAAQSHRTEATAKAVLHLLDYCATYPNAKICYNASNMVLKGYSGVSYLSKQHTQSRAGGYFYLSNNNNEKSNGPLLIVSTIL